ncbi:MAG: hypothetical protein IPN56_15865 [Chitinophagaceae bacterium]|nr:hypothetical protein [Chitinophagaceae bacterium]
MSLFDTMIHRIMVMAGNNPYHFGKQIPRKKAFSLLAYKPAGLSFP